MNDSILFKTKNINLFCPWTNEYLFDYIYTLGYADKDLPDWRIKIVVLSTVKILLSYNIVNIYKWIDNNQLSSQNLTTDEIILEIDKIWFESATYEDFFKMVMFGTPEWYTNKLKEIGMTETTNWQVFVNENIGDLKKWIEENRPQKSSR